MDNLSKETSYRNIIEMSCMTNNDEWVSYTKERLDPNKIKIKKHNSFDEPRLVISRPVHNEEIKAGLQILDEDQCQSIYDEVKIPEITLILDDFYKLENRIKFYKKLGCEPQQAICNIVANSYYDCMSGAPGKYFLSVCRWFIENFNINLGHRLYPKQLNDWHCVQDFLREIEDIPRIESILEFSSLKKLK